METIYSQIKIGSDTSESFSDSDEQFILTVMSDDEINDETEIEYDDGSLDESELNKLSNDKSLHDNSLYDSSSSDDSPYDNSLHDNLSSEDNNKSSNNNKKIEILITSRACQNENKCQ